MRNSVKATVDAYDGTVTLYEFDDQDPVLKAWNKAFGGNLIMPKAEIPPTLAAHFRYPEDLFKVQRDLLARFHVTNPAEFFSGQDFWQVPNDAGRPGRQHQAAAVLPDVQAARAGQHQVPADRRRSRRRTGTTWPR